VSRVDQPHHDFVVERTQHAGERTFGRFRRCATQKAIVRTAPANLQSSNHVRGGGREHVLEMVLHSGEYGGVIGTHLDRATLEGDLPDWSVQHGR
jgi:hypothetical protein